MWKQYNFRYIDSSYINLKSFDRYPGLLYYIKSQYTEKPENLKLIDEITKTESIITLDKNKFEGYNIIDPNNAGYYSTLTICEEGFVYSSATSTCIAPALTKCLFPGDINDNCITCEDSTPYLNPIDGSCVSECPDFYYENKEISIPLKVNLSPADNAQRYYHLYNNHIVARGKTTVWHVNADVGFFVCGRSGKSVTPDWGKGYFREDIWYRQRGIPSVKRLYS